MIKVKVEIIPAPTSMELTIYVEGKGVVAAKQRALTRAMEIFPEKDHSKFKILSCIEL